MAVDFSFLLSWSPEKAWFLGALYGDGNVYRGGNSDYRVSICGNLSTVSRWLRLLDPDKQPQEFKRSPGTYQGYVNSKVLVEWFASELHICGPKADSLVWPEDLPPELMWHFVRGLWDTDGSLGFSRHAGYSEFKVRYSSNTQGFVERVYVELQRALDLSDVAILQERKQFRVQYSGANALAVARFLYGEAPVHLRNETKTEIYLDAVQQYEQRLNAKCDCGAHATHEGLCQRCWWDRHGRSTGEGTSCVNGCGKPILAHGLCSACYTRGWRSQEGWVRKSTGLCECGKAAYRRGMCDACYSRERRAMLARKRMEGLEVTR